LPWAVDNGAYSGFDEKKFVRYLKRVQDISGCIWVAAPDVVGDGIATLKLFRQWAPRIHAWGFPVAFVSQDGSLQYELPWDDFECLFIGGTTEWKLGGIVREQARVAKYKGKLLHMGRVNSRKRLRYAASIKCDSVDGSSFNWFSDIYLPKAEKWLAEIDAEEDNLRGVREVG